MKTSEITHLKTLLKKLTRYVGYASCAGNKCRLPHCHDCSYDAREEGELLEELQEEISKAVS